MRRMREDRGRFGMMLLAGLALMGWLMPTTMALGQEEPALTLTLPQKGTVNSSTGEVTLIVDVTCNQDTLIGLVECNAFQVVGRTHSSQLFGANEVAISCGEGQTISIPVLLEPGTSSGNIMQPGPTPVSCDAFCTGFPCSGSASGSVILLRAR